MVAINRELSTHTAEAVTKDLKLHKRPIERKGRREERRPRQGRSLRGVDLYTKPKLSFTKEMLKSRMHETAKKRAAESAFTGGLPVRHAGNVFITLSSAEVASMQGNEQVQLADVKKIHASNLQMAVMNESLKGLASNMQHWAHEASLKAHSESFWDQVGDEFKHFGKNFDKAADAGLKNFGAWCKYAALSGIDGDAHALGIKTPKLDKEAEAAHKAYDKTRKKAAAASENYQAKEGMVQGLLIGATVMVVMAIATVACPALLAVDAEVTEGVVDGEAALEGGEGAADAAADAAPKTPEAPEGEGEAPEGEGEGEGSEGGAGTGSGTSAGSSTPTDAATDASSEGSSDAKAAETVGKAAAKEAEASSAGWKAFRTAFQYARYPFFGSSMGTGINASNVIMPVVGLAGSAGAGYMIQKTTASGNNAMEAQAISAHVSADSAASTIISNKVNAANQETSVVMSSLSNLNSLNQAAAQLVSGTLNSFKQVGNIGNMF